jgi:hypothetical protein
MYNILFIFSFVIAAIIGGLILLVIYYSTLANHYKSASKVWKTMYETLLLTRNNKINNGD